LDGIVKLNNIVWDEEMGKIKNGFYKVVEWDKKLARKFQQKFDLSDYQMLCIAFAKGFVIGAILL
jgi:hypothetical protein